MSYQTLTAYFLSGTGNAYRVATWWGEAAAGRNVPARIAPIALAKPGDEVGAGPGQSAGINRQGAADERAVRERWRAPSRP
jgi:hypothetical protein